MNVNSKMSFPNQVGDRWVYDVFDSTSLNSYDVTVTISTATSVRNKIMNVWTFKYPTRLDTNYVTTNSDTIVFIAKDKTTVIDTYVLPLAAGSKWFGSWIFDIYSIPQRSTVSVHGQSFEGSFNVKEIATSPNFRRSKDEWFTPYVGMVKKYRFEYAFSLPDNKVWYLKSWNL